MVIKKIYFCLIVMLFFVLPFILAETIEDRSVNTFNLPIVENTIQTGNAIIQPTNINKLSCGEAYLNNSLIRGGFGFLFVLAIIEIVLKGFGMWRAAKRGEKKWFIAILLLSFTIVVPLIYLVITRDKGK